MRAARTSAYGSFDNISIDDIDQPKPGVGEILVRVEYAALNPLDFKIALGRWGGGRPVPHTFGYDAVGLVADTGPEVSAVGIGDRVALMADLMRGGAVAEYVVVREHNVAVVSPEVDSTTAAALPLAGLTAVQILDALAVQAGDRVLIQSGAGGVGHLAIQLAKARGAEVIATASAKNLDRLRAWGADRAVDYRQEDVAEIARSVDAVLDPRGGEAAQAIYEALRPEARFVSIVAFEPSRNPEDDRAAASTVLVEPRAAELQELLTAIDKGALAPHIDSIVPLDEFPEAIAALHQGHTIGKRLIAINA